MFIVLNSWKISLMLVFHDALSFQQIMVGLTMFEALILLMNPDYYKVYIDSCDSVSYIQSNLTCCAS